LRGISTLVRYGRLLNPFRYGWFSFELVSHKIARWLVPFFLVALLASSAILSVESHLYLAVFVAQLLFYGLALAALAGGEKLSSSLPIKVSLYFSTVNLATLSAWVKFARGVRQELWSPSRR
jgi:hypothetical protein